MLIGSSLKRDTLFYGTATLIERFISFLILPLLTKTLPQEVYGVWAQMIVTVSLLSSVILLGFHTAIVRFLAGTGNDKESSRMLHLMLTIVMLNCLVVIVSSFLFTPSLSYVMFGDARFSAFIPVFGFFLVSEALFELLTAFLRARKKIRLLALYYILKNAGRIAILSIALLGFQSDLLEAVTFIVMFQILLTLIIYVRDIPKHIGLNISIPNVRWKEIAFFSLPLVPYSLLIWANNFVDRYLILHILDLNQVSIYAVAYSLASIVGIFYSVIGFTLYPYAAQHWNEGDKGGAAEVLQKATEYYLFFAIPVIALLTTLSSPIIKLLSTAEYISNWQVVLWLSIGIGVFGLYQLNVYSTILANKTLLNLGLSAIASLINVIFNLILIPFIGILGAAVATALSNSILAFCTIKIGQKHIPYIFPWGAAFKIVLSALVMAVVLSVTQQYIEISNFWELILFIGLAGSIYGVMDLLNKNSFLLKLRKNI